ncbi:MAG: DNRLRE domain-containing protein [Dysgonamonadaceae bacterium]|jgi:hypothetical protein|nr:DNRLRE domain-containing protein [Dysgonamonadaceae bacterium]
MKLFSFVILFLMYNMVGWGQILTPTDDGYIYLGGNNIDRNYGSETELKTCYSFNKQYNQRTYIRFEWNTEANYFSSAKFRIYGQSDSLKVVEVYSAVGNWQEDSLTGMPGAKPSLSTYLGAFEINNRADCREVDITDYVNYLNFNKINKISIVLVDREHQRAPVEARFYSKENKSQYAPRLELVTKKDEFEGFIPHTYYVDSEKGDDKKDGKSPGTAWKSPERAGKTFYKGGDKLLFKKGCRFPGSLFVKYLPLNTEKLIINAYGSGENPVLDAEGKEICVLKLFNTPFVEVKNLEITQSSNIIPVIRRGIYYLAEDFGAVRHVRFDSLTVRNIVGNPGKDDADMLAKSNAGIFSEITGNNIPTYFDGYYLENSYFCKVGRHGATNQSSWQNRSLTENINWVPSENLKIRKNVFEETASDGLIVRVANKPLMEYNLFKRCSIQLSGNASFSYNCDSALWQFNEACYTVYNTGDHDAAGFDSDYKSKHTIFQYNYAHHNEYGDMLITGGPASSKGFNDGTIVRYNVFCNNAHHGIRVSGLATNTQIYGNICYHDEHTVTPSEPFEEYPGYRIFYHKNWGGWPQNTSYTNNIYHYTNKDNGINELNEDFSKGTTFNGNTVFGENIRDYPPDSFLNKKDPLLYFPLPESVKVIKNK